MSEKIIIDAIERTVLLTYNMQHDTIKMLEERVIELQNKLDRIERTLEYQSFLNKQQIDKQIEQI